MTREEGTEAMQFFVVDPEHEPPGHNHSADEDAESEAFEGYKPVQDLTVRTIDGCALVEGLRFPLQLESGATYVISFVDVTAGISNIKSFDHKFVVN